ncbi:hypothetical protein GCM10028803_33350 [Larkinella knui]|uniref:Uncharacterized protein n=1 Tax=Larkinella knui TaxID=2025310 RepID=A0A3P1CZM1_9BACT|nr:hypothetical protein [Larkinella knui]RRB18344.1 hypothetical protein EHT87_08760 [Larkinella knui]
MRKSALAPFAVIVCLFTASCHRPYARYQPIPVESFRSSGKPETGPTASDSAVVRATELTAEAPEPEPSQPDFYASATGIPPTQTVQQRARQATTALVNSSARASETSALPQPRPKTGKKKTLREILGLKPRKKLNWWQRIPWQLKASVPVIGVAIVFAVLNISILAIIFGLLGAFLLIRGLKKTFRVRRPWF